MSGPRITLVAAIGRNGVIGRGDLLPWRLKSDMVHFKAATMGKPVLMGRRTFLSIGRPLPGRTNIVLTRDAGFSARGVVVATSLEKALEVARGDAARRSTDEIIIAGGADLYAQTLPLADRLVLTEVALEPQGDVLFPPIPADFVETTRLPQPQGPQDEAPFAIVAMERRV